MVKKVDKEDSTVLFCFPHPIRVWLEGGRLVICNYSGHIHPQVSRQETGSWLAPAPDLNIVFFCLAARPRWAGQSSLTY